ncbi:40271_t:CDS:2, partial [Gigaspora margarita]
MTIYQKYKKKEKSFEHLIAGEVDKARWLEKEYSIFDKRGGEDLLEGAENGSKRQKLVDKKWDKFKKKMVWVTEE